jgi:hypothetical protein
MQTGEDTKLTELKERMKSRDISNSFKEKEIFIKILKYRGFIFIYNDTILFLHQENLI